MRETPVSRAWFFQAWEGLFLSDSRVVHPVGQKTPE